MKFAWNNGKHCQNSKQFYVAVVEVLSYFIFSDRNAYCSFTVLIQVMNRFVQISGTLRPISPSTASFTSPRVRLAQRLGDACSGLKIPQLALIRILSVVSVSLHLKIGLEMLQCNVTELYTRIVTIPNRAKQNDSLHINRLTRGKTSYLLNIHIYLLFYAGTCFCMNKCSETFCILAVNP